MLNGYPPEYATYFDRIFNYATMKGLESAMDKLYSGLNDELGFKIY